jgi:carotenoid 1,2-hydratase
MDIASLLHLDDPAHQPDPAVLDSLGGYLWWYVDLLDATGTGLVLIGSWGLPFLPGYAAAARSGRAQTPRSRPSLNVVTYAGGRPDFYLLQELRPEQASWTGNTLRFGDSILRTHLVAGRRRLEALLDCPLPGTSDRLQGGVAFDGVALQDPGCSSGTHRWTPLAGPSTGAASLTVGGRPLLRCEGPAYHDRNWSPEPLQTQGLERWAWGRVVTEDALQVYYVLWPKHGGEPQLLGLSVDSSGRSTRHRDLALACSPSRRSRYGPAWHPTLSLTQAGAPWLEVRQHRPVEQGPFYLRLQQDVSVAGGPPVRGWGELCVPGRIDRAWERPLVRMRVHRPGEHSSVWNPLFTGTLADRARRQARSLWPQGS